MPSYRTIVLLTALTAAIDAQAGTLTDGKWTASNCGTQTAPPEIDSRSVEGYNRSLKAVREWQQKTQAYNDCVVKEANADNAAIAEAANGEQARFRAAVERISAEAAAIKTKLDRQ
jgi:hypothetical protein